MPAVQAMRRELIVIQPTAKQFVATPWTPMIVNGGRAQANTQPPDHNYRNRDQWHTVQTERDNHHNRRPSDGTPESPLGQHDISPRIRLFFHDEDAPEVGLVLLG